MKFYIELYYSFQIKKCFFSKKQRMAFHPASITIMAGDECYVSNFKSYHQKKGVKVYPDNNLENNYPLKSDKEIARDIYKFIGKFTSFEDEIVSNMCCLLRPILEKLLGKKYRGVLPEKITDLNELELGIIEGMSDDDFGLGSDFVYAPKPGSELTMKIKKQIFHSHPEYPMISLHSGRDTLLSYRKLYAHLNNVKNEVNSGEKSTA